ncbi:NAD(P)H-binding protein [Yoonia sp. 208BN28-4]|uniref:NAD(P)H-binding protein n=1 Tax=Yoonia sp. 208BN28-4 TaxID=3126505 RepID=UPI0030A9B3E1
MKRVVIAGATECLGRHLCAEYQQLGWYVIALVGNASQAGLIAADQLAEAQATNPATLVGVMAGADLIVSCLGMTRQPDRAGNGDADYQAILNLLREAEHTGVGRFAYVYFAEAEVQESAAKTAFVAELQRSAIKSTVMTTRDSSGHAHAILSALGMDPPDDKTATRCPKDDLENRFASKRTPKLHLIPTERKSS